ncbi:hypothetical protein BRD02_02410 [Halobacteriales archaeon QS_8_69_73]|nr:MAG: hypothetical protein BRD02_02410 [Halobacteriales archaeon QS_8_69_73]
MSRREGDFGESDEAERGGVDVDLADPVRALVVDDDPETADVVGRHLRQGLAVDVTVAAEETGRAGLARLEADRFDAMVADYRMSRIDGLELLDRVRKLRPRLPFILFTGRGDEDLASRAISAGVTDYVPKTPGTEAYELLARRLASAVARRRAEHEVSDLNSINRTIRKTTQRAVEADGRSGIERAVCRSLADSDRYLFAWLGRIDGDRVVPAAQAGAEAGYLDDITVRTDGSPAGCGPAGRAARTGEPQATTNIREDPNFEPWRTAAVERGYASAASVPLEFDDTRYGLLNVYAEQADAFDDRELDVLEELGTTVAHAIHRATLTDRLEDQYETLFEESPVMATTTRDENGEPVVDSCNRLFIERLGYDRAEVVGRPLADFYTADSVVKLLEQAGYDRARSGEFAEERRTLVADDGERVETLLRAVPREDETGDVVGTLALYVDISERERLQQENERLDEFTSVVSHDLRNPLTVIKGRAELASKTHDDDEDIDAIVEAAGRMQELVDDLLDLARHGRSVETTEPVELSSLAADCWELVDTDAATLDPRADLVVAADEPRLRQLLENLFRNAVEHGSTSSRPEADDTGSENASEPSVANAPEDAVEHGSTSPPSQARENTGSENASEPSVANATEDAVEHGSTSSRPEADDAPEHGPPAGGSPDGLTVTVGGLDDAEGFYVEDDGTGVPPSARGDVFEPGHSTDRDNTGFGLSIVEGVAESHGWTVELTEGTEGGARFEFRGVDAELP